MVIATHARTAGGLVEHVSEATESVGRVFPPFDLSYFSSHFFWLAISFGCFYLFVSRVIVSRIGGVIETRQDRIASDLDYAVRMKKEADAVVEDYEKKLVEARLKAYTVLQEAREKIKEKVEAQRRDSEKDVQKKLSDSESRIRTSRDQAMQHVGSIAEDLASEIVKKLVDVHVHEKVACSAVEAVRHQQG